MRAIPVLVAYHTADWIRVAVESYLHHIPGDRLLVVDNNPRRGEPGWRPECERERQWLASHPRVELVRNPAGIDAEQCVRTHGSGMDEAMRRCRDRGADVMVHLEPDCLVSGTAWRENLLRAIEAGAWMAGSFRKSYGPIHPTPSAWRVDAFRSTFNYVEKAVDKGSPHFAALFHNDVLHAEMAPTGSWGWWDRWWDTGEKAWFDAAVHDRAALVEAPDFRHYWLGSTGRRYDEGRIAAEFPELAPWLARSSPWGVERRVETCPYRDLARVVDGIERARCGLLRELSGVEDDRLCEVRRDACEACCDSFAPSAELLNPVVASRLFNLAGAVLERGGVAGCDAETAAGLRAWAERELEIDSAEDGGVARPRSRDGPCVHLGEEVGIRVALDGAEHRRTAVQACGHPEHEETTPEGCVRCRDWSDGSRLAPTPIEVLVPPPAMRLGPPVRRWAVGVTTALRRQPTLRWCLDGLARAGWDRPRLFVDATVTIPAAHADLPVTFREHALGAWPNYYLALVELLMREPEADAFLMVQDDALFDDRHDLRGYLERWLWPADPIGAVSLYCSSADTKPTPGWHASDGPWVWGALAFVFSRASAKRFVTDPVVFEHRRHPTGGLSYIDIVIGRWAERHGLPIYHTTPSLVQHVGDTSTLSPIARAVGSRRADRFAGDEA